MATALAALMPYVSGDNLSTWRLHRPEQAVIPAFLEAAGLDASIAVDGTTYTDLPTLPIASWVAWAGPALPVPTEHAADLILYQRTAEASGPRRAGTARDGARPDRPDHVLRRGRLPDRPAD